MKHKGVGGEVRDERIQFVDGVREIRVVAVVGADVDEDDVRVIIGRQPLGQVFEKAVVGRTWKCAASPSPRG